VKIEMLRENGKGNPARVSTLASQKVNLKFRKGDNPMGPSKAFMTWLLLAWSFLLFGGFFNLTGWLISPRSTA
jgi:hypothetical protein